MSIIALDLDDVVADLVVSWVDHYNSMCEEKISINDIKSWKISDAIRCNKHKHVGNDISEPSIYFNTAPIKGALSGVRTLRSLGHRIFFATSAKPQVMKAKFDWLIKFNFIQDINDLVIVSDKSLIKADILIDDKIENILAFSGRGILYTRPWNALHSYNDRVNNWVDILVTLQG